MHSRLTTLALTLALFSLGAAILLMATGVSGGPLDPAGPPGPTQSVIEPRTPISQPATFPIVISEPGSYYLTQNVAGVINTNGIEITTSNVTVDLNGFTLQGALSARGIYVTGAFSNITVRNGTIKDWSEFGILGEDMSLGRFEDLTIIGGSAGLRTGSQAYIARLNLRDQSNGAINIRTGTGPALIIDTVSQQSISFPYFILGSNVVIRRAQATSAAPDAQGYTHGGGAGLWVDQSHAQGMSLGYDLEASSGVVTRSTFIQNDAFSITGANNHVGSAATAGTGTVGSSDRWSNVVY
jgi:hypothetical protein